MSVPIRAKRMFQCHLTMGLNEQLGRRLNAAEDTVKTIHICVAHFCRSLSFHYGCRYTSLVTLGSIHDSKITTSLGSKLVFRIDREDMLVKFLAYLTTLL